MRGNKDFPDRRRPSEGAYHLDRGYIVFVTVCTRNRRPWLANSETHGLLCKTWTEAAAWRVGRYVILPDHVHLFAAPGDGVTGVDAWLKYWKSRCSMSRVDKDCRWQARAWHSRLRTGESYSAKWEYVRSNPVRHGLVAEADDWPYQGEIHELFWL